MKNTRPEFIVGNVLDVLADNFEDDSVDLVCTSPPYWGLRDYGSGTDAIWGGDGECVHEWSDAGGTLSQSQHGQGKSTIGYRSDGTYSLGKNGSPYLNRLAEINKGTPESNICHLCGAWKGQLGLEPTWQLYVEHMVETSREIKRVLKPTGSYYLVLGDTYFGGPQRNTDFNERWGHSSGAQKQEGGRPELKMKTDSITKPKQKLLIPYRVAIALQEDGWICRNDITWRKPNAMPSSVKDRLTCTTERIFHFVKNAKGYFYDLDAIRKPHKEGSGQQGTRLKPIMTSGILQEREEKVGLNPAGKNPGDAWRINTAQFPLDWCPVCETNAPRKDIEKRGNKLFHNLCDNELLGHFAVFPEALIEPIIKSSCPPDGVVLDPFCGSGTTNLVAMKLGRASIGIDINKDYIKIAQKRCRVDIPSLQDYGVGDE